MNQQNNQHQTTTAKVQPRLPILVTILTLLLLIDGIFTILGSFPALFVGGILLGGLTGLLGIGKIVTAIGLRKMKTWALYGLFVFVIIGIILSILVQKKDLTTILTIVYEIIILAYFWTIYKSRVSYPKILILGIIVILLAGGIFAWQYFGVSEEEETGQAPERVESPYIKIISPNDGGQWVVGDTYNISWESSGVDKIDIGYKREGSGAEINGWVGQEVSASQSSYSWTIPAEVFPGPEYNRGSFQIRIGESPFRPDLGIEEISDISDNHFIIVREDETAGWKTYKNEKYGIEFQYPNSWILDDKEALSVNLPDQTRNFIQINVSKGVSGREGESTSPCQPSIASAVYQVGKLRDSQQTFEEFVNFQIENPERGMPPVVKPKLISTIVGGHNALQIEGTIDNCTTEFYYVEENLSKYMTISFITDKNDDKLLFNQILSTFKFSE